MPKAVRDRLGWPTGLDLEVIEGADSVTLRRSRKSGETLTMDEAIARLREIYTHRGPPVSTEDLKHAAEDAIAEHMRP